MNRPKWCIVQLQKSQKWAYKFFKELGVKSPFFRAWFGDWRSEDKTPLTPIVMDKSAVFKSGNATNVDTGEKMSWNSEMQKESILNASKDNKADVETIVANIARIVENGILLDTTVSTKSSNRKLEGTSWMHSFYSVAQIDGRVVLLKLYAENAFSEKQNLSFTRAYSLKHIKKIAEIDNGVLILADGLTESHSTISINSVSDLFHFVKLNEPPKMVYRSTHDGPIRIISCQACAKADGAAQQLSDELGVKVLAPTESVFVDEKGRMFVSDNNILAEMWHDASDEEKAKIKETGKWIEFKPREGGNLND